MAVWSQSDFLENAVNTLPWLSTRRQHISTNDYTWCPAMHSHTFPLDGCLISQVILLGILAMHSHVCVTSGSIFPPNHSVGDADNAFSCLSNQWQNFLTNEDPENAGNAFLNLSVKCQHDFTSDCFGDAGKAFSRLFKRWQHFPSKWFLGKCWQHIVMFVHVLSTFFHKNDFSHDAGNAF